MRFELLKALEENRDEVLTFNSLNEIRVGASRFASNFVKSVTFNSLNEIQEVVKMFGKHKVVFQFSQ